MSVSIYKTLIESYQAEDLKSKMRSNLTQFQKLLDKYINEDDRDEFSSTLGMMLECLNNVVKLFDSMRIYL